MNSNFGSSLDSNWGSSSNSKLEEKWAQMRREDEESDEEVQVRRNKQNRAAAMAAAMVCQPTEEQPQWGGSNWNRGNPTIDTRNQTPPAQPPAIDYQIPEPRSPSISRSRSAISASAMASGSRFRFNTSLSKRELEEPLYAPEGCYLEAGPDAPVFVCITENPNFQKWRETGLPPILPGADRPWWENASLQVGPKPSLADALYDEKTERLCVRRMIAGALSRVSEEVGGSFRDSVNAFDPCKVAAEVEAVLFDNWGFRDLSNYDKYEAIIHFLILDEIKEFRRQVLVGEIPPEMLLNMSFEQLQQRYPQTRSYLDYVAPK